MAAYCSWSPFREMCVDRLGAAGVLLELQSRFLISMCDRGVRVDRIIDCGVDVCRPEVSAAALLLHLLLRCGC